MTLSLIPDVRFEDGQEVNIPQRHIAPLTDLTDEESAEIMDASRRLMRAVIATFERFGVLVFQNNGICSGQVTPH